MTWIAGTVVGIAVLALLIALKLHRDAIRQNSVRVGSALLAEYPGAAQAEARFIIVRGEPRFQPGETFEHRGKLYEILAYRGYDDSSTVLRRFIDVTCRMIPTI